MLGRVVATDEEFWELDPPLAWKWPEVDLGDGGPDVVRWLVRPPCGHHFMLAPAGRRDGPAHVVEEHEDGTISVKAPPEGGNSILCSCGWHGYVDHNDWQEIGG